jgi:hypothetical protein
MQTQPALPTSQHYHAVVDSYVYRKTGYCAHAREAVEAEIPGSFTWIACDCRTASLWPWCPACQPTPPTEEAPPMQTETPPATSIVISACKVCDDPQCHTAHTWTEPAPTGCALDVAGGLAYLAEQATCTWVAVKDVAPEHFRITCECGHRDEIAPRAQYRWSRTDAIRGIVDEPDAATELARRGLAPMAGGSGASAEIYQRVIAHAEQEAARSESLLVSDPAHSETWRQRYSLFANEAAKLRQDLFTEHGLLYRDGALCPAMAGGSSDAPAHTPGPWYVETHPTEYPDLFTYNVLASHGFTDYRGEDQLCSVANGLDSATDARLIAAAPALLEALREIVQYTEPLCQEGDPLGLDIRRIATNAIKQAEGR